MSLALKPGYNWQAQSLGALAQVIGGGSFRSADARHIGVRWLFRPPKPNKKPSPRP